MSIVHAFLPRQWRLRLVVVLVAAQSGLELYLQVCYYDNLPNSEAHTHDLLYCYVRVITPRYCSTTNKRIGCVENQRNTSARFGKEGKRVLSDENRFSP